MALEGLSKEQIDKYEYDLLDKVHVTEPVGNITLLEKLERLGWNEELYWQIRNSLIERGLLVRGRGRGGSIRKVLPPNQDISKVSTTVEATIPERI